MSDVAGIHTIIIKSHSNISKTVSKCLAILAPKPIDSSLKPTPLIVKIQADAKVAGKAITITEIVTRRIKEHGGMITQSTIVQEKPAVVELPVDDEGRKHLQGEGYEKRDKNMDAQIVICLETSRSENECGNELEVH